ALRRRPVESVVLAGIAAKLRRIPASWIAVVCHRGVALLRDDVGAADGDRRQLVAANAPGDHFFLAGFAVEVPPAAAPGQRHREGPLFVADDERLAGRVWTDQVPS